MKTVALALCIVILLTALVACAPEETIEDSHLHQKVVDNNIPIEGGILNLTLTRFNNLNPLFNSNRGLRQLHNLVFEGLVTFNQNMDLEPLLAEKWEISEDGQSILFFLREDVQWHDGTPFTAEDVIFTFQAIKGNIKGIRNDSIYSLGIRHVSDMRIVDGNRIKVTFNRPFSNGLEIMTYPILPSHLFKGGNIHHFVGDDFPMIGTGPFKLIEYQKMKRMELRRNTNYWGQIPFIEGIKVLIVPDKDAQISMFENEKIDFTEATSIDWGKYIDHPNINVFEYVSNLYEFIGFNFRNQLMNEINIRRAIAYGINRTRLINNVYLGHATVVDVPIFPQSWLYNDKSHQYGYDIERAQQLLERMGFYLEEGSSYRVDRNGNHLSLTLITNNDNPLREKTAFFIKEELAVIGIELKLVFLDWKELNDQLNSHNYDMVLGGWQLSSVQDLSFAFHSAYIGDTNFIAYSDERMNQLLEGIISSPSREEKRNNSHLLQQHISNELPYFSLFFQNRSILLKNRVRGNIKPHLNNLFEGIENWYIYTEEVIEAED